MRLCLNGISVSFGDKEVLKDIKFEVNSNDKVAVIGRNGCGKTTLLRVITGQQEIDGSYHRTTQDLIEKMGRFEIGYLKQIAFDDDNETLENEVLKVFEEVTTLKQRISDLEQAMSEGKCLNEISKYESMLRKFDMIGGYTYQKEYNQALKKFGFSESDKIKRLSEFSGGQRTKIALVKLLLSKPDLLILDEPTNHLDITAIKWLEDFLAGYNKAVVVVSHDRAFLDRFVNTVYEIERGEIKKYVGNYSDFIKTKSFMYEQDVKAYEAYIKEKNRLQNLADRFRYKATKASMAQSKLKQIERMEVIENPLGSDTRVFATNIKPRIESGDNVLFADEIEIGYTSTLTKISFRIMKGDRVGVVGGNGFGKSTLLKSIVNKIPLLKGKLKFGTNVEVGYFDQQTATNNIADESVLENFQKEFPEEDSQSARTILGSFMFTQDDVFKNLKTLSGGELVRLELCKILTRRPNFLILDEPTNHMDIVSKEALESMLEKYEGTILFVSHDRYFVNKIAKSLIVFDADGGKYLKNTTYKEYEDKLAEQSVTESNTQTKDLKVEVKKQNDYFLNKEKARNETKKKKIEKSIEQLEVEIKELQNSMQSPEICSDFIKILEIQKIIDEKNIQRETLMNEWFLLSE